MTAPRSLPVFIGAFLLFLAASTSRQLDAQALTLRMAAYVPTNSPWDLGLKRLAAEYDRISGGTVKIVFPQSVKVADESDVIQKMRFGVDGALLTTIGIAQLYPDSFALSMPWLIRNDREFDAVLESVGPLIRAKLEERYYVVALAKGGWVRLYSKSPIDYPEDLVGMRVSVSPTEEKIQKMFQSVGARTVKSDMSGLILQLNSNAVDAFYLSPVFVASLISQYKGKIAYVSSFRVSPFIGALVFNRQSWDKVPAELRPRLEEATRTVAKRMAEESAKLEENAIAALLREGLKMQPSPADADARWDRMYQERRGGLIASMFSADILETIDSALARARGGK